MPDEVIISALVIQALIIGEVRAGRRDHLDRPHHIPAARGHPAARRARPAGLVIGRRR
jgi:hypothetical protein